MSRIWLCAVSLLVVALSQVTQCHNHDTQNGVKLGMFQMQDGLNCPVWAVSYNALRLDCQLNINGLSFLINETPLTPNYENGQLLIMLDVLQAIPETTGFNLMIKRGSQVLATLDVMPKELPKPIVLNELSRINYGVKSGNVTILNANTLYLPNFYYNGGAPDAFFWVGKGAPDKTGRLIPDERGTTQILGAYRDQAVTLKLPDGLTVDDIDYLSVWCREYSLDFGHVRFPSKRMVPPVTYMPREMDYSSVNIIPIAGSLIGSDNTIGIRRQQTGTGVDSGGISLQTFNIMAIITSFILMKWL